MVDVSEKAVTRREAVAEAHVRMQPSTRERIAAGAIPKGDVFAVARLAGIMAAKRTHDLVPLCHPLPISSIEVELSVERSGIHIRSRVTVDGKTGVEMEALTAAVVAALTVYDMCKSLDRGMTLGPFELLEKSGGKSGHYIRKT